VNDVRQRVDKKRNQEKEASSLCRLSGGMRAADTEIRGERDIQCKREEVKRKIHARSGNLRSQGAVSYGVGGCNDNKSGGGLGGQQKTWRTFWGGKCSVELSDLSARINVPLLCWGKGDTEDSRTRGSATWSKKTKTLNR